ncbi:MAG: hypothetical protein ACOX8Q_06615 [Christensenellales bacterium]|jgi:N6-L-threonylcarbamoyladenine synthase
MGNDAVFLAFDTSCYTTSIAAVSNGNVLYDKRLMLAVKKGNRGMRQSEAVFHHLKNLRQLFLGYSNKGNNIKGIGFSAKPCPREGSYMPVFCVGESYGIACASLLGAKTHALTHQHGHIYSAFFGNPFTDDDYCVFHVSGGTLDILHVRITGGIVADIKSAGGTLDITCGQLIDRIGVAAGLGFPSGNEMERMYIGNGAALAVNVLGLNANLSGAETQAIRLLQDGRSAAYVCSGVIDCVARTLTQLIKNAAKITGLEKFIFTGGVICNNIIREKLNKACQAGGFQCILAQKAYCSDNACGLALAAGIIDGKGERS